MTEEFFDIVDAADQPIGVATRAYVHQAKLRHRAAHVLLYNRDGLLYLQRRSPLKDCSPGLWDTSAAGHLNQGEAYAVAARRELFEELGIEPDDDLLNLYKLQADPATGYEFVEVFRTTTRRKVRPDPTEIAEGRWCTHAEVGEWIQRAPEEFTGTFRKIWGLLNP